MQTLLKLSRQNCNPCKMLSLYLEDKNIQYKEIDIEQDEEYVDKYNLSGVPVLILLDENGEVNHRVDGFNRGYTDPVDELLEKLK